MHRPTTLLALVAGLAGPVVAAPPAWLDIQGQKEPNACNAGEQKRLRADTQAAAGTDAPEAAWALVRLVLCGTGAGADAAVMRHAPKRLAVVDESTGEASPPRERVTTTPDLLLARRAAWAATVSEGGGGSFQLSFQPDEATMRSYTLRFNGQGWRVVQRSEASD